MRRAANTFSACERIQACQDPGELPLIKGGHQQQTRWSGERIRWWSRSQRPPPCLSFKEPALSVPRLPAAGRSFTKCQLYISIITKSTLAIRPVKIRRILQAKVFSRASLLSSLPEPAQHLGLICCTHLQGHRW